MTFFNKKTDVIGVELTQYGKHLLSIGKFKPTYYDFFDNDILYDGQYGSITESRNDIQERIKNGTPYSKPQYLFYGVETKIKEQLKIKHQLEQQARSEGKKINEAISVQQPEDKLYFTSSPLGTSNLSNKLPVFNVFTYNTQISSSSEYKELNSSYLTTPQITMNKSLYNIFSEPAEDLTTTPEFYEIGNNFAENSEIIFNDGNTIKVDKQSIIIEINELNIKQLGENFDIELYEITSSLKGRETYKQLYFSNNADSNVTARDSTLVEYYFTVKLDEQIDTKSLNNIRNNPQTARVFQEIKK